MTNKDGISNTIATDNWKATTTKEGVAITIKGPYENTVIHISNEEMEKFQSKSMMLQNRLLYEERQKGNDVIYRGKQL